MKSFLLRAVAKQNPEQYITVDHLGTDLRRRSVRGGAVTIGNQAAKLLLTMGSTAIIARILTPDDFGVIAMVLAIIGFIAIFKDLGLAMATVQRNDISHRQVSTLFWINVGVSLLIALIMASMGPVLGWFYNEPRVVKVSLVLAGTIVFSGLTVQHQALLRRQMRFGAVAVVDISAVFIGFLTGVLCALAGMGYWSLVAIPMVRETVAMLGMWICCGWRPGKPVRSSGVRALVSFGAHLTGFNIVNYFA
ncbi:MAG: oligosaccharide flippase family protein, partial [Candidatus Latescibacterota bacterium]